MTPTDIYRTRPHLQVVCCAEDWAFVITEANRRRVLGRVHVGLLAHLKEPLPYAQLVTAMGSEFGVEAIRAALEDLVQGGYVDRHEGDGLAGAPDAAWSTGGGAVPHSTASAEDNLGSREDHPTTAPSIEVALHFVLTLDEPAITQALTEHGIRRREDAEVVVVVVHDYLDPSLAALVDQLGMSGRVILPFKPYGSRVWLGPALGRGASTCWSCLLHRIETNRPVETYLRGEGWRPGAVLPKPVATEASLSAAAQFMALEFSPSDFPARDRLVTFDLQQQKREEHVVVRRPQCPRCGDPEWMTRRMEGAVALSPRRKSETTDGGHRIESPESTYRRVACHVDPLVGLVSSLGEFSRKSHERYPVFGASHFVQPAPGPIAADERFHQLSIGKGKSPSQARTSALCEALERKCARFQGDEPRRRGSLLDLAEVAIDPRQLLLFSDRQYALGTPDDIKARWKHLATPRSQVVPRPFDPSLSIDWAPAWSLTHGRRRYVPFGFVVAGAPQPEAERMCAWDSNGCAAGNCLEEAILQGLFELIERDATAIWWYNRVPRPQVDLARLGQPYFLEVRARYAEAGHELWVLDLTHDLGIPVVIALTVEIGGERYAAGLGCHLDLGLAVQRALTELNQVFDPKRLDPPLFTRAEVADEHFLHPLTGSPDCMAGSHANRLSDDLRDDILLCLDRLHAAGLEVLVCDYSRADVALSTVKVMVPGLRHFWPRLAPGRLYDVPVSQGWLPRPLQELELNPLPLLM